MNRTIAILALTMICTGCYRSHDRGWAATEDMLLDDGWLAGDLGEVQGFAGDAYAIEVNDRRTDAVGALVVKLHSGQRGGDAHGWSMIGLAFGGVDPLDERFAAGRRVVVDGGEAPIVDVWACSGPAHGAQVFEERAIRVALEVEAGSQPGERVFLFEAVLSNGQRVDGGFSVLPQ